jgi:hypothetical protein
LQHTFVCFTSAPCPPFFLPGKSHEGCSSLGIGLLEAGNKELKDGRDQPEGAQVPGDIMDLPLGLLFSHQRRINS